MALYLGIKLSNCIKLWRDDNVSKVIGCFANSSVPEILITDNAEQVDLSLNQPAKCLTLLLSNSQNFGRSECNRVKSDSVKKYVH